MLVMDRVRHAAILPFRDLARRARLQDVRLQGSPGPQPRQFAVASAPRVEC